MSNEITVKLECSIDDVCRIFERKDYKVIEKYLLDDTYFVPKNIIIEVQSIRNIVSQAILLRDITGYIPEYKVTKQTFKSKQFDEKGNIISQNKVDCEIVNAESGREFFNAIGYKELIRIKELATEYEKDGIRIVVKDIINGDNLIEIEENDKYNSIEQLVAILDMLEIPFDRSNYFVKKAEIELEKLLK